MNCTSNLSFAQFPKTLSSSSILSGSYWKNLFMLYFKKVKVFTSSILSSITEVVYNLDHNILRFFDILTILVNQEISEKYQNCVKLYSSSQSSCQNRIFINASKKVWKIRYWTFSVVRYSTWNLKFFSSICPWL